MPAIMKAGICLLPSTKAQLPSSHSPDPLPKFRKFPLFIKQIINGKAKAKPPLLTAC